MYTLYVSIAYKGNEIKINKNLYLVRNLEIFKEKDDY